MMRTLLLLAGVACGTIGLGTHRADAAFVDTAIETSSGVVFSGSGSINLAGLILLQTESTGSGDGFITPFSGNLLPAGPFAVYGFTEGPGSFGSGFGVSSTAQSGDAFGFIGSVALLLPINYVSGSALASSLTFGNQTFASLGVTPGTYVHTFGADENFDTVTLQIGPAALAVPEPATLAVLGTGVLGLGLIKRRRG